MSLIPGGIGGTPPGAALDQFLRDSYEVVQAVHRNLDSIRAVADHLTPVEDLVEFRNEVTALHANLGVLAAASELITQANDAGIDLLLAVDAEAQRVLLGLKSAALQEASYFATSTDFVALSSQVAQLSDTVNQILLDLATKVSRAELDAALVPLLARLDDLEDGVGLDETNDRITQLISQLQDGSFGSATAAALGALTTRVTQTETGLTTQTQRATALEASVAVLETGAAGSTLAIQQLTSQVTSSAAGVDALVADVVELTTRANNLETGQSAASTAMGLLQSRTTTTENSITAQGLAINQLTAGIADALNQAALNTTAISGLETRMISSEAGQLVLASDISQLGARVTDTETGLDAAADATQALTTRVESTEGLLVIAAEERTSLRSSLTSTGNHLPNSSFAVNLRNWTLFSRGDGWLDAQLERNLTPTAPGALPDGMFALSLTQDEVPSGNAGIRCANVPIEDLATYILSGYLAAENCTVRLEWRLRNGAGVEIGFGLAGEVTNVAPSARLSEWGRVWAEIPVAMDGAQLQVQVWITNCNTGFPKAWLLRPQLEPKVGDQQGPSPWMDGVTGIEETFSTAVQSLETRVIQTEEGLDTLAQAIANLGSSVGVVREWCITHHSGSATFDTVGAPQAPGLYLVGLSTPAHTFLRGLTIVRFAPDGTVASATRFDTFSNATERNNLRDALLALDADDPFILVSQDHHGIKQADLTAAVEAVGGFAFANVVGSKPYILIGRGAAGKGGGLEVIPAGNTPWQTHYVTVVNDTPKGVGERTGLIETMAGQANALDALTTRVTDTESGMTVLASDVTALDGRLDVAEGNLTVQAGALSSLTTEVANIDGEVTALSSAQTALAARMSGTTGALATSAMVADEATARAAADTALADRATALEATVNDGSTGLVNTRARLIAEEAARADADTALGNRTTTIEGRMSGTSGALATQAQVSTAEAASVSRDNALGSRIDMTDAVVAGKASSGAVSALSSRVDVTEAGIAAQGLALTGVKAQLGGTGANLVVNSCGEADLAGWILTGSGVAHSQMSLGRNYAAPYTLPPGTMYVAQAGASVDGYSDAQYHDARMVVEPGKRYCVQVLAMAHRTTGTLFFKWNAANGSIIGGWLSADIATTSPPITAGDRLELFQRVSLFAVAPVGAATVSIMIRKYGSAGAPNNDSYLFFTRLAVNEVPADLTTPPPWAPTATGLDSKYAAVTQSMQAEVTSVGNVAKASHTVTLDVNGNISGTRSENTGTSSMFSVLANVWRVISSGTTGLEWRDGYLRAYSGAIQLVLGINFGASSNLCFWYGPNVGASGCTKTNGTIWFDNGGDAYFGGSLSAGILKNAAQSTQASKTATVTTGTFGSNGNARLVVGSFSLSHVGFVQGNVGGSSGSIVLTVRRSSTVIATVTISGGYTANYDSELNTTRMVANFSGSVTHTDNTGGNSVEYSSTLSGATGFWPMSLHTNSSGIGPLSTPVWRTSIISTEE